MALKHLRSTTENKRPQASGLSDGQLAMNTASGSPGLFFKDTAGSIVKIGPVHVGPTAPNVSPASGGTTGNSIGEQWLDNSGGTYVFKIWDGAAWRSEAGEFVSSTGDTMTGSLTMGQSADIIFEGSVDDGFETTLTVANPTADRTITLPNVTGTVVTTGDSGSVTSTMIANGTIVDADVNASAAIAGTKVSPNFGSQTVQTTGIFSAAGGSASAPSIAFTGDTNTGIYSPEADQLALSTNGTGRLRITSGGQVLLESTNSFIGVNTADGADSSTLIVGGGGAASNSRGAYVWMKGNENTDAGALVLSAGNVGTAPITAFTGNSERLRITSTGQLSHIGGGSAVAPAVGFNGSAPSNSLVINSTGKVGIGTSAPGERFTVANGDMQLQGITYTNFSDFWGSGDNAAFFLPYGYLGSAGAFSVSLYANGYRNNSAGFTYMGIDGNTNTAAGIDLDPAGEIFLRTGTASGTVLPTRLFINSSGNVGIGTSSPDELLHIEGDTAEFKGTNTNEIGDTAGTEQVFKFGIEGQKNGVYGPAGSIIFRQDANTWSSVDQYNKATRLEFCTQDNSSSDNSETPRLVIDKDGNVGIGTTSPTSLITSQLVSSSSWTPGEILDDSTNNSTVGLQIRNNDTSASAEASLLFIAGSSNNAQHSIASIKTATNLGDLVFRRRSGSSASAESLRIDSSGRLGIGTSSPGSLLHTNGSRDYTGTTPDASSYDINFQSGAAFVGIGQSNGIPTIQGHGTGTAYNLALCPNAGRVGIGTTSPGHALEVNGDCQIGSYSDLVDSGLYVTGRGTANGRAINIMSVDGNGGGVIGTTGESSANNGLELQAYRGGGSIVLKTAGDNERARIDSSGRLLVGTSSDSGGALLQVNGNRIRVATAKTPASASDTGTTGEICWDANYIYVCTATNTWKRTAIATW